MTRVKTKEIILPALRGVMGNWVYYTCLMSIDEIARRVSYADEIHKNKKLSDMIQRSLKAARSAQIADYIKTQEERFFNSLVVATYGGQPNWSGIDRLSSKSKNAIADKLSEETLNSVGFLSLSGEEKLFALDGQHRLSGIKKAVKEGLEQDPPDDLSVIFVAHKTTPKGMEKTRRLFTTLNKTAKPVSKGDIIALDEDDVMAICVRRLIEESTLFNGVRVAFVASNNMPVQNTTSLTTIGNLYDILTTLFTRVETDLKAEKAELQRARPDDKTLEAYFKLAKQYFELMAASFTPLSEFFAATDTNPVVKKYRGSHGGSALFRPIGLIVFTDIVAHLSKTRTLKKSIELAGKLPHMLTAVPFEGLMWDSPSQRIDNTNRVTLREVLLYMVGDSKWKDDTVLGRYQRGIGDEDAALPKKVV
ncbi:DGQHR domain-containing protein [Devosia marina]|uniref:DGQHR domain-containing protein n=1 Tax=Devosia marina TaxID=2683198 RepID=A0A7X3FSE1_9HYPH|nr:DGQHR domain-containing protein [Devosia marina]MVS99781.1 DGQHR domain-containing protein [Devosia marina]